MKTTDLQPILDAVLNIETKELAAALRQHGGSYKFPEDECSIMFYNEFKGPMSGTVNGATIKEIKDQPVIKISITDDDYNTYDIDSDSVFPGQLSVITAWLPEPKKK